MNLILLYGPPAVGKLTIAKVLQKKLGYKLLHNHMLINLLTEVFDFENPSQPKLVQEFRLRIIEEAVRDNIDLIVTIGKGGSNIFGYFDEIQTICKGQNVFFIQVTADTKDLFARINSSERREHHKDISQERLQEILEEFPDIFDVYSSEHSFSINTSILTPEAAV